MELKEWMKEHMPQKCKSHPKNHECPKLKTCIIKLNEQIVSNGMTMENSSWKNMHDLINEKICTL